LGFCEGSHVVRNREFLMGIDNTKIDADGIHMGCPCKGIKNKQVFGGATGDRTPDL
jgi:hypothetical protein